MVYNELNFEDMYSYNMYYLSFVILLRNLLFFLMWNLCRLYYLNYFHLYLYHYYYYLNFCNFDFELIIFYLYYYMKLYFF